MKARHFPCHIWKWYFAFSIVLLERGLIDIAESFGLSWASNANGSKNFRYQKREVASVIGLNPVRVAGFRFRFTSIIVDSDRL